MIENRCYRGRFTHKKTLSSGSHVGGTRPTSFLVDRAAQSKPHTEGEATMCLAKHTRSQVQLNVQGCTEKDAEIGIYVLAQWESRPCRCNVESLSDLLSLSL